MPTESPVADLAPPSHTSGMDPFFRPKTLSIIGATDRPNSVGAALLQNALLGSGVREVFAVNPHRASALGQPCYRSISSLPIAIDLAVICTPAESVPEIVRECVDAGVGAIEVISAGFREMGAHGQQLEQQIRSCLSGRSTRLLGPNCLGLAVPGLQLNATFSDIEMRPGSVAFISQSGALLSAILDWSRSELIGFRSVVSLGSMLDVDWADLIDHFGDDPGTSGLLLYIETIGDAQRFRRAASRICLKKPIFALKAGRSSQGARAAHSHTGSLAGDYLAVDTLLRQSGVLRVASIPELFYSSELFHLKYPLRGPKLAIVTNSGGPGVLATDALVGAGAELAALTPETMESLNTRLPEHWSRANPVDVLGDADVETYVAATATVAADKSVDAVLAIMCPQKLTHPKELADALVHAAQRTDTPILSCWMGGQSVASGRHALRSAGVPFFSFPETAARCFAAMWAASQLARQASESIPPPPEPDIAEAQAVDSLLRAASASARAS